MYHYVHTDEAVELRQRNLDLKESGYIKYCVAVLSQPVHRKVTY